MLKPVVDSSFDVAFWLIDRALDDGEYLQPPKMHHLMFLAQAYFASTRYGEKLMPAVFLIGPEGPIEPTIFRAMERGRPLVDTLPLEEEALHVLDSVWRKFGPKSVASLNTIIKSHPPFAQARENGIGTEISFDSMVNFYFRTLGQQEKTVRRDDAISDTLSAERVVQPKILRSHTGKQVAVNPWLPKHFDKSDTGE
ncbi:MAG: hypothetical protein ACJZ9F_11270 [Rhodospirillaceae bacterium]